MWFRLQTALLVLGFLLIFAGNKLSIPLLFYTGMACIGMFSMAVGWEAIITRQIVVGRRRKGNRRTYTGIPAMFQGVQFNLIGLFLIAVAVITYMRANFREVFLQMVRHPGLPFILLGILILMQAVITMAGSLEQQERSRKDVLLGLLLSRGLPGFVLIVMGLGMMGLGMFEIVAPSSFDALGGGFLETLYGLR